MKHLHLKRTIIIACVASIIILMAGCTSAVTEQQVSTEMRPGGSDREGMMPMAWGMQRGAGEAALFDSNIEPQSYAESVSGADNPSTYYDAADIAGNYTFHSVAINLGDSVFHTDELTGLSIVKEEEGTITIRNSSHVLYEYVLTGTLGGQLPSPVIRLPIWSRSRMRTSQEPPFPPCS